MNENTELNELLISAEENIKAGELTHKSGLFRLAAYHFHQAVEKLLKAYLLFKRGEYPFIHSISRLLIEILKIDDDFIFLKEKMIFKLDKYYTGSRYPPLLKVKEEDAKEALEIAQKVREFILKKIK
jgi:Uncharacterized conserved protein related to C-terminal domain of eukaryotic chaperone, SACSIN